ncbi:TIGR03503 family protein [Colwellia sp. 75C3]|uniref:TIGR03503 family protein n=1 Tax=Colwellia sp. 75C3 TaxID=888425 RepID=UPI000C325113|nr:TIGR03503 family protein [Colwellia sp. 75C3]PKG84537.1 TIGR03503 family protein [Colwellia sp. 75C3]
MEINRFHCFNLLSVKVARLIACLFVFVVPFNAGALFTGQIENINEDNKLNKSKVEYYQKDNITNQVPYFDNRFRLDADLEEITLIFYRKSGSTPIILIRPDGSKIRVNQFDHEKVQWFDDSTFDMIKIKKPMPGPWQAVGDILPNSQILVVSDVKIAVEPLPEIAFSGETLKVEGRLFNGDEAINSSHFTKVVKLDVNFYSTNNSLYENFGADAIKVTSFRDDGRGLDEYANDNTFTGEFILNFAPGEWQPVYLVKLPMATRELRQQSILLHKTPIEINVVKSDHVDKPHQLQLSIDPTFVDPNSLVFQGKFTFPDRQIEPFSIMEENGESRTSIITNTEPGLYRVNVSAFGKTITGREFRLVVPEFSFNVETSLNEPNTVEETNIEGVTTILETTDELLDKGEQDRIAALLAQKLVQDEKEQETFIIIAVGNGAVIVISVILFFFLRRKKKSK